LLDDDLFMAARLYDDPDRFRLIINGRRNLGDEHRTFSMEAAPHVNDRAANEYTNVNTTTHKVLFLKNPLTSVLYSRSSLSKTS
jgi:hypothetical protein